MKNITFFAVIILSFPFGMKVDAQSYDIRWTDRIGPNNATILAEYADLNDETHRRVYRNGGPYYLPTWLPLDEEILSGSGTDMISLNQGGDLLIKLLVPNGQGGYTEIENLTTRLTVTTLPEPSLTVYDVVYGQPPLIRLRADIHAPYGPGRDSYYVTKLKCRIERTLPDDYEQTVEWTFPVDIVPFADFELPWSFFGDYCFQWYITDEDTSLDSHFGETTVWESETLCFSYGSTGFQSDRLKIEFGSYPNPFTDIVTIKSPSETLYRVTNLAGQNVASGQLFVGENRIDVLSGLSSGMYILETELGSTKLVKQ